MSGYNPGYPGYPGQQPAYNPYNQNPGAYGGYQPPPPAGYAPPPMQGGQPHGNKQDLGVVDFLKRHGTEVAGAALSYKMGGGIGKFFAANSAANLAQKYQSEQKQKKQYDQPNPYNSQPPGPAGYSYPSSSHQGGGGGKDIFGQALSAGGALFSKGEQMAKKFVGGGSESLKLFQTGNVIQLISRQTGRALQILRGADGRLVLDALGAEGPQVFNAHFTVIRNEEKTVMLHNNNNFLMIMGGHTQIHLAGQNGPPTPQCQLKVKEPEPHWIALVSTVEAGCIAVGSNGELKPAYLSGPKDPDAFFGLRLVYSPYGPAPPASQPY